MKKYFDKFNDVTSTLSNICWLYNIIPWGLVMGFFTMSWNIWAVFFMLIISLILTGSKIYVWIIKKLYSHRIAGNYTKKRIPFMDCIQCIERYLTKNNKNITALGNSDVLDAVHFGQKNIYSPNINKIILHVLEACKNAEITLYGRQGALPDDISIEPHHIDKTKIIFADGLPELHNGFNKIIYNNLTIEKNEAMKWAIKELLPSITRPS